MRVRSRIHVKYAFDNRLLFQFVQFRGIRRPLASGRLIFLSAIELVLTGDSANGSEFERLGVVNKVFPPPGVIPAAIKLAERIAGLSGPVIQNAKSAVLKGMLCYTTRPIDYPAASV